jgi:hypothetical protein
VVVNKYIAGLLTLGITLLTAAIAIPESAWSDPFVIWQFVALAVSSITAIFLPLAAGVWAGVFKTGSAAVLAGIGALIPLLNGVFGVIQWLLVIVAILNAVAIELGVNMRVDSVKETIVVPEKYGAHGDLSRASELVDPKAAAIAESQLRHHAPVVKTGI